ncbi:MAG: hypothetical protein Kow0088_16120 [Anaerolineales bacterium]
MHLPETEPNTSDSPTNVRPMKKNLSVVVEDEDLLELMRILMDDDAEAALAFLKKHFKGKARDLLEGG